MRPAVRVALAAGLLALPAAVPADEPIIAATPFRTAADELKLLRLPPGFEAQLVAAEPDIQKPINLAFDAKGRLWVTCTVEYPFPAAEGRGRDTVRVLEDFGPDGRARKVTTFAGGLNIPIGVLPYKDGAIVYSIPNLWRLRDTDGDGKCDRREVLVTGFGHRDTHGMINGLTLGFDGWVYCNHGFSNDSDAKGTDGSEVRMNSGNVFRLKPDGSHVELVCKGQVNPFGQCLDEYGNHYTSDCHSKPITQLLRGAVYHSFFKPHDRLGFGPEMVHQYRGSTALCGLCYYAADQFPEPFRHGFFLGDVVNNRINFFTVERKGGTYTATQRADFATTADGWFRPVDIKLGPDGALYVADFYNRIIGHYEVPLTHPGRDRTSGRIWRIVYKGTDGTAPPPKAPRGDWTTASVDELIRDLAHPNLTVRMIATHQLVERGPPAVAAVKAVLKPETPAAARAHALWVLERLGALEGEALTAAAKDEDILVRVHALRILAERPKVTDAEFRIIRAALTEIGDGLVRRVAADALGRHPSRDARRVLLNAITDGTATGDPFLKHTLRIALREQFRGHTDWTVVREQDRGAMADVALGLPEPAAADFLADSIGWLADHDGGRLPEYVHHVARYATPDRVTAFIESLRGAHEAGTNRADQAVLLALLRGAQERGGAPPAAVVGWAVDRCVALLNAAKGEDIKAGIELAAALRHPPLQGNLLRILADRRRPEAVRAAALDALKSYDPKSSVGVLALRLADAAEPVTLREKVAQSLAGVHSPEARAALLAALPTAPARLQTAIAADLAATPDGASALLDTIAAGKASPRVLQERAAEVKLETLKRPDLAARVKALTAGLPPADERLAGLLRGRATGYKKGHHEAAAGVKVFEQHCAACHQIAGKGAKVGPQLDGIGARGLDRLLEDVLDPNRNVDQSFRATVLTLKNGQSLTGLVLREEGAVIVLADAQGKEQRIERKQVAEREVSPLSPMPANWADQIAEKDFDDLIAYLLDQRVK
ncbi:MAG TPA: PVC-type heme-binding CxxCH protein [Gemmataceae bacterium]|jgi:putative heme-binding domain-containing protein